MADELPLTRSFLESVTTAELLRLADNRGIDLPPGLDRTIVIEELLDIEGDRPGDFEKAGGKQNPELAGVPGEGSVQEELRPLAGLDTRDIQSPHPQPATAPLPKHYNISYIEVLIRDPLWAFAFWEINAHDKEIYEQSPDFNGYCLRVLPVQGPDGPFTVQVGTGDSAWYLGFPPEGGNFKVELCVIRRNVPMVLAVSKLFRLPTLPDSMESGEPAVSSPLLRLSGIDDFKILRNTMRSSRLPRRSGARSGATAYGPRE
ncbi:DUF4912 domain-containing protein [Spirochaetia bacterium]|nr:DUF4912 domain-containing protein [Spirochaetia bacterium]